MDDGAISIRRAIPEDWDQISRLSAISGYEDYINEMGPAFLDDGTILIAENRIPIGFMKISTLPDNFAWFSAVRVHPDYRRLGVGNSLMKEALKLADDGKTRGCRLMIENSNFRSKGLALKNGFHVVLDLLLFEGGFSRDGLMRSKIEDDEFFSMGWEFCLFSKGLNERVEKYTMDGKNLYHYEGNNGSYQFHTGPLAVKVSGDVKYSAVLYQEMPDSFPLKPVDDFRRAQVFGIEF